MQGRVCYRGNTLFKARTCKETKKAKKPDGKGSFGIAAEAVDK